MPRCLYHKEKFEKKHRWQQGKFRFCISDDECYNALREVQKIEQEKKKKKDWNKEKTQIKEKLKSVQTLVLETQKVFNLFIRERDKGLPCISCGNPNMKKINASHYYNANNHWNVRFDEDNVHSACEYCNTHLSGNLIPYRKALIEKIGMKRFERLESIANDTVHFTKDELNHLKTEYQYKIKQLK